MNSILTVLIRILNAFQVLACFLWTVLGISFCAVGVLCGMRPSLMLQAAHRPWSGVILWICGVELLAPTTEELPQEAHLYVANHNSVIDIPVLFRVMRPPLRFIAKKQLFDLPIFGWYLRATNMVPIDRSNIGDAKRRLATVREKLQAGSSIVAFPEGTRSRDGRIGPFKRGAFITAIQHQISIVPVAIHNAAGVVHRNGFSGRPGTIRVAVGDPISTEGLTTADRAQLAERTRAAVLVLHEQLVRESTGDKTQGTPESLRTMASGE